MKNNLLEKIDALPPLPKSVIDLEEFRKSTNKEPLDLLKIIDKLQSISSRSNSKSIGT